MKRIWIARGDGENISERGTHRVKDWWGCVKEMVGMCARWKEHSGKGTDIAEEKVKMKWLAGYSGCSRMLSW